MLQVRIHWSLPAAAAGIAVLCTWPGRACAGDAAPAEEAADAAPATSTAASSELSEVVVTARRRAESKDTTPISITAVSADKLAEQGINDTTDLQRLTPGVVLSGAGSLLNTTYTIRGQTKAIIGPGLPSVINYFNEIPMPSWGSVLPTYDVNNVQILKGPQGTLFGRNTTGGAFLVYSQAPEWNFGGFVEVEGGNFGEHSGRGALNIPLVDDVLAVRLAGDFERRRGYTTDVVTGEDKDAVHSNSGRISILFTPTHWLEDTLVYDYSESHTTNLGLQAVSPRSQSTLATLAGGTGPGSYYAALSDYIAATYGGRNYATASNVGTFSNATLWGVSNTTKLNFGDWGSHINDVVAKNIFGYRSTDILQRNSNGLSDTTPLPYFIDAVLGLPNGTPGVPANTANARKDGQISDEVQLGGTAFSEAAQWLLGLFYLDDRPTGPDYINLVTYQPTLPGLQSVFGPGAGSAIFNGLNAGLHGIWPFSPAEDSLYTDRSRAAFANVNLDLGKFSSVLTGLTLDAGYRYTWDNEGVCSNARLTSLATAEPIDAPYNSIGECRADPTSFSDEVSSSAATHTLGLDYKLNDSVFLYFTTRAGYRAGGINTPSLALDPDLARFQTYRPQTVTDYELGTHTRWSVGDVKGTFDLATFVGYFKSVQLGAIIQPGALPNDPVDPSNTSLTLNAGKETVGGVEIDGSVAPVDSFVFSYAGSYLNPHLTPGGVPPVLIACGCFQVGDIPNTPRFSYNLEGRYQLPIGADLGRFFLTADWYYITKTYLGSFEMPAYGLANANLEWQNMFGKPLTLTLYGNNLLDKAYVVGGELSGSSFAYFDEMWGPPRMYGARLRYSF